MFVCKKCRAEHVEANRFCTCGEFIYPADEVRPPATSGATVVDASQSTTTIASGPGELVGLPALPDGGDGSDHAPSWFPRVRAARAGGRTPPAEVDTKNHAGEPQASSASGSAAVSRSADTLRAPFTLRSPDEAEAPRGEDATSSPPDGRPRQGLAISLDREVLEVVPGQTTSLVVTVANTGVLVEGCRVHLLGMPDEWLRVEPPRFNLDVDHEQQVTLHLTPPRSTKTPHGRTAMRVEVASLVDPTVKAQADGTMVIEPFRDLVLGLEPAEVEAKRATRTYLSLRNEGNASEQLALNGTEPGNRLRFTFKPADFVTIEPGEWLRVAVDLKPRHRLWTGTEKMRSFSIGVDRPSGPAVTPVQGRFTQSSSAPRWLVPLLFAVLAVAVPLGSILMVRNLKHEEDTALVTVPDVRGAGQAAAAEKLKALGLIADITERFSSEETVGKVTEQSPTKGTKVEKKTTVQLFVSSHATVPDVTGLPWDLAKRALEQQKLTMNVEAYEFGSQEQYSKIAYQIPLKGQPSLDGVVSVRVYSTKEYPFPDVTNLDQITVESALKKAKIVVTIKEEDSSKPRGRIVGQVPAPDSVLKEGDEVTLLVSNGHPPAVDSSATPTTGSSLAGETPQPRGSLPPA